MPDIPRYLGLGRRVLIQAILVVPLAAGVASCDDEDPPSADELCIPLCSAYEACSTARGDDLPETPSFCAVASGTSLCVSSCTQAMTGLGESQDTFARCAECVVNVDGAEICDDAAAEQAGLVSCPSVCDSERAGAATAKFRDDFYALLAGSQNDDLVCSDGTIEWDAADAAIGHRIGEPGAYGSWMCEGCSESSHLLYGPNIDVPEGRYRAGVRDVYVSGLPVDPLGTLEVGYATDTWPFSRQVTLGDFDGTRAGEISLEFELDEPQRELQIRWYYSQPDGQTNVSVGSLFIRRFP